MATYEKVKLSGSSSTNVPIIVSYAIGTSATVHQTGTSTTVLDEVWMWLSNTSPYFADDYLIRVGNLDFARLSLQPLETALVIPGVPFSGDGSTGVIVNVENMTAMGSFAFAFGYVNRITP